MADTSPIKVNKETFQNYKERLARTLLKYNFHAEVIANNTDLKNFIENYVVANCIDSMNRDKILGITKKLANMEVKLPNNEYVSFPIIHTYKWHNLVSSTIFYIDENGECKAEKIELEASPLIVT